MVSKIDGHPLQPEIEKLITDGKSTREISAYCKEHDFIVSHVAIARYIGRGGDKDAIKKEVNKRMQVIREEKIERQVTSQAFLEALMSKGYEKLLNGDYENVSVRDLIAAARILMPLQVEADVVTTVTMEDVVTTLSDISDGEDE